MDQPDDRKSSHITPGDGNVFADLGFSASEAKALLADADARIAVAEDARAVEGVVVEVLSSYGLAHVCTPDGATYGITRDTPGVQFGALREGQRVRCEVTSKFNRVLRAQVLPIVAKDV